MKQNQYICMALALFYGMKWHHIPLSEKLKEKVGSFIVNFDQRSILVDQTNAIDGLTICCIDTQGYNFMKAMEALE